MPVLHLPPGALGVDHWSGRSYHADRRGHVLVPDDVARDYQRNGVLRHYDVTVGGTTFSSSTPGCPACHFAPYPWQVAASRCPRCGAAMEESGCSTDAATSPS
jgi:hypothetical protein